MEQWEQDIEAIFDKLNSDLNASFDAFVEDSGIYIGGDEDGK